MVKSCLRVLSVRLWGPDASLKDIAQLPGGFLCLFVVRVTGLSCHFSEHIRSLFRNLDLQSLVLCITFGKKVRKYCHLQMECVAQTTCDLPPMITSVIGINSKVASCVQEMSITLKLVAEYKVFKYDSRKKGASNVK